MSYTLFDAAYKNGSADPTNFRPNPDIPATIDLMDLSVGIRHNDKVCAIFYGQNAHNMCFGVLKILKVDYVHLDANLKVYTNDSKFASITFDKTKSISEVVPLKLAEEYLELFHDQFKFQLALTKLSIRGTRI